MSRKRKVLQGSASNLIRVLLSMLVSLVLPPFLVHHMAASEYSAWVLILQLSAYVNLLDFGLQTAIGKYVAEYDAGGHRDASHSLVSTSFTLLALAAAVACAAVAGLALSVPKLFHQMPASLVPEVRIALLAVGLSSAFALAVRYLSFYLHRVAAIFLPHRCFDLHAHRIRRRACRRFC